MDGFLYHMARATCATGLEWNIRIQLINPTVTISKADYYQGISFMPPLGLAYLASVLCEAGHEVSIIDRLGAHPMPVERTGDLLRCGIDESTVLERMESFAPELIGITCPYTANARDAVDTARLVKRASPGIPVLMGGAHASVCPEELLAEESVDYVIAGEGEDVTKSLVAALESGAETSAIDGLMRMNADGVISGSPAHERIKDLDSIPFPRRDLLPMEQYFKAQQSGLERINNIRWPKTTMITSRGCPENCVFCAIRCTWGRKWKGRSPGNVVNEIEGLVRDFGVREIDFLDDSLSVSRSRLEAICNLIIEREIDIKWTTPNGIAIWSLDEDLLKLMKRSGCYRLTFGLESGDSDTIDFIRKRYTRDYAQKLIGYANRIGLWTIGTFILGFPYETRAQMEHTIRFAIDSGLDLAVFYCAAAFPGTDLYKVCASEGIEVPRSASLMLSAIDSTTMTAEQIARVREDANGRFARNLRRRPWKVLEKIKNVEDCRYAARVSRYALRLSRRSAATRSTTAFLYSGDGGRRGRRSRQQRRRG